MTAQVILPPLKYFNEVWKLAEPILDAIDPKHSTGQMGKVNVHRLFQVVEAICGGNPETTKATRQLAHDWKEEMIRSLENPYDTDVERQNLLFGLVGHLIEFLGHADELRGDGFDTFDALMNLKDGKDGEESCTTEH